MSHLFHDIRGEGFVRRARVSDALAWLTAVGGPSRIERLNLRDAGGRCLAEPVTVAPPAASGLVAQRNGVGLKAEWTRGASARSPVALPAGEARPFQTGEALPPGFDAVAPYGMVHIQDGAVEVTGVVEAGENVQRPNAPPVEITAGRPLTPSLLALLAAGGATQLAVHRKPRVRLVAVGSARNGPPDQTTAALAAAVARDGGIVTETLRPAVEVSAIAAAFSFPGDFDLLLAVGRTGSGPDDLAPLALAAAGDVAFHGLALRPGGSTAAGRIGDGPAILLPGQPFSALTAYAMLAAPLLRKMEGVESPAQPLPLRETFLQRKLVSDRDMLDVFPVRIDEDGLAHSLGDPWRLGAAALAADGVVLAPEGVDALPAGSQASVFSLDCALGYADEVRRR